MAYYSCTIVMWAQSIKINLTLNFLCRPRDNHRAASAENQRPEGDLQNLMQVLQKIKQALFCLADESCIVSVMFNVTTLLYHLGNDTVYRLQSGLQMSIKFYFFIFFNSVKHLQKCIFLLVYFFFVCLTLFYVSLKLHVMK